MAEKYEICIELTRDVQHNYLFSKIIYSKKPSLPGEEPEPIEQEEEEEPEEELEYITKK